MEFPLSLLIWTHFSLPFLSEEQVFAITYAKTTWKPKQAYLKCEIVQPLLMRLFCGFMRVKFCTTETLLLSKLISINPPNFFIMGGDKEMLVHKSSRFFPHSQINCVARRGELEQLFDSRSLQTCTNDCTHQIKRNEQQMPK